MFKKIKMAGLSVLIGLGALAAAPGAAQADNLYFGLGIGTSSQMRPPAASGHRSDHNDRYDRGRHDNGRFDRDRGRRHGWQQARACTPNDAMRKAERYGMRRARIVDVNRRTIRVSGRVNHHRAQFVFGRAPGCPMYR